MPITSNETHSPESIRNAIRRLQNFLTAVDTVADQMTQYGIESMAIDNQAALERAMEDLNRWVLAAQRSLTKSLIDKGAFRAESAPPPREVPKKARRRKQA